MPTQYLLPDLCDAYPEKVNVVAPQFNSYGGKQSYHGQIVTIKCHEDNSLVAEQVDRNGDGKVLVVDGGGSLRCGLLGDNLAAKAVKNRWQGILVYGCIRDVDEIGEMDLGVRSVIETRVSQEVLRHVCAELYPVPAVAKFEVVGAVPLQTAVSSEASSA